jgi:DNA-directed RNA polymerase subunit delta
VPKLSLKHYSKEQLKELSLIEMAYEFLVNSKQPIAFTDLVKEIQSASGISDKEMKTRIAQFYTDVNIDGRFLSLGDNRWGLRVWYPVDTQEEEVVTVVKPKKKKAKKKAAVVDDFDEIEDEDYDDLDDLDDFADDEDDLLDDDDDDEDDLLEDDLIDVIDEDVIEDEEVIDLDEDDDLDDDLDEELEDEELEDEDEI